MRFNPEFYRYYRPFYPADVFIGLRNFLNHGGDPQAFTWVDVGCGTGHSIVSAIRAGLQGNVIGIDPDPHMLEQARDLVKSSGLAELDLRVGTGEATGLPSHSVDMILVASAFHWMNGASTKTEFLRVLKPGGIIHLFEYQFPKASQLPDLNEWIRRQFNLYWKAPLQKPRGDFAQITRIFIEDDRFGMIDQGKTVMLQALGATDLWGLILSQSRVLCFEETLSSTQIIEFRESLLDTLKKYLGEQQHLFEFKLSWLCLQWIK